MIQKSYFFKFFIKLIFLLIILNILILFDYLNLFNLNTIKNELYYNINFYKAAEVMKIDSIINKNQELEVISEASIININGKNRLICENDSVITIKKGNIIKINKENSYYNVFIQTSDDEIYVYKNLSNIDVQLYQTININKKIGKTKLFENGYYCNIDIIKSNNTYED